jgi:hypothetical protein
VGAPWRAPTVMLLDASARRRTLDGVSITKQEEPHAEPCLRCGAAMEWRHGTFQCPRCRFKVGCCEGVTGECRDAVTVTPR